jgi:hypothetical protein
MAHDTPKAEWLRVMGLGTFAMSDVLETPLLEDVKPSSTIIRLKNRLVYGMTSGEMSRGPASISVYPNPTISLTSVVE